jgi:MFS family permease
MTPAYPRVAELDAAESNAKRLAPEWVLPIVLVGSFLAVTDLFIVNVALPTIGRSLAGSDAALELVVAGYNVAYACCLVAGGRLGDVKGRRRFFLGGMAAFVLASAVCGIAPDMTVLVAGRVAQGIAAAAMVPQVLATIQSLFDGPTRARAIGWFGATVGLAIVFGQVVGGLIVAANIAGLGWRPVFLLNVPVGIVGFALAYRYLPETRAAEGSGLDSRGTILLAITLVAFLVPVAIGRDADWPWWCWLLLGATPLAGSAFYLLERRWEQAGRVPLMPPSLLRLPGMRSGLLAAVAYFPGAGGFLFTTAVIFQDGRRFGPLDTGLALAPYAVGFLVASLLARHLAARIGRWVIVAGGVAMALGLVAFAGQADFDFSHLTGLAVAPAFAVIGFGNALVMIPLFSVVLSHVPLERAGVASGVLTTTQQAGLGLGAAALGTVLFASAHAGTARTWSRATVVVSIVEAALAAVTAASAVLLNRRSASQ